MLINQRCMKLPPPAALLCWLSKFGISGDGRGCWDHAAFVLRDTKTDVPYLLEGGLWGALRRLAGKGPIVEVAHMELADPSIEEAFGRCVRRGARSVVVAPFFLAPGRHVTQDLPELTREASERHGGAPWAVAEAIGPDPMVAQIMAQRVEEALEGGGGASSHGGGGASGTR